MVLLLWQEVPRPHPPGKPLEGGVQVGTSPTAGRCCHRHDDLPVTSIHGNPHLCPEVAHLLSLSDWGFCSQSGTGTWGRKLEMRLGC